MNASQDVSATGICEVAIQACLIHMRGVPGAMLVRWIDFRILICDPSPSVGSKVELGAKTAQVNGKKRRENKAD